MKLKNILFLIGVLILLSSCIHINQRIHNLAIRSSKSKVLKTLGRPFKIQRKGGRTYWTYKFVIEGRHYTRNVILEDGMLYKKEPLKPYSLKKF